MRMQDCAGMQRPVTALHRRDPPHSAHLLLHLRQSSTVVLVQRHTEPSVEVTSWVVAASSSSSVYWRWYSWLLRRKQQLVSHPTFACLFVLSLSTTIHCSLRLSSLCQPSLAIPPRLCGNLSARFWEIRKTDRQTHTHTQTRQLYIYRCTLRARVTGRVESTDTHLSRTWQRWRGSLGWFYVTPVTNNLWFMRDNILSLACVRLPVWSEVRSDDCRRSL